MMGLTMTRKAWWGGSTAAVLALAPAPAAADDFSKAKELIAAQAPKIAYKQFCSEAPTGADKAACRIQKVPTIGFLVCQRAELEGAACKSVIATETANLTTVVKAGLATVTFKAEALGEVQCYAEKSTDCYGYLARWVSNGKFVNLDDAFEAGEAVTVANDIEKYTKGAGVKATAKSLQAIINFMQATRGKFNRICDLQGFYLQDGGFLINDVPELIVGQSKKPDCGGDGMPSYDKALAGLETVVRALNDGKRAPGVRSRRQNMRRRSAPARS